MAKPLAVGRLIGLAVGLARAMAGMRGRGGVSMGWQATASPGSGLLKVAVPALFAVAAEQNLPMIDAFNDPRERRRVVGLLAWLG